MWCVDGAIDNPTGAPADTSECFSSPLDPPYEFTELSYDVFDAAATLADFELEIRQSNAGSRGNLIESLSPTIREVP